MKIPRRKRDYSIPVMFAIAVILSAVCFASRGIGTSTFLAKGLSVIVTPLQSGTKHVYDFCSSIGSYFEGIDSLKKENKSLESQNKKLKEENEKVEELKKENDSLYKFLEIKKEHTDYKFISGNIISRTSSGYSAFFTLNKGSKHGIKPNMPVISEEGVLVGVTYSVDVSSTQCKSIFSYDMNIGIYNERTGETAILSGDYDTFSQNKCLINSLPEDTTFKKDDIILTSGYGEVYPRDLKIGVIESFVPEKGSHTMSAIVNIDGSAVVCDKVMVISSFESIYE